ncbi:MAG TPA: DCC1-like thiol-disulfide oxidoreductase family protein, partial [Macellibacteroides fermentans]|nr:DCC1-like thiol-disulfide oxidoreductase family protein [Macellibacteroides fermentans]
QSDAGRALLERNGVTHWGTDSIVFIPQQGDAFRESSAVLYILKELGRGWQLFFPLIHLPTFLRDGIYRFIARNRYRWFGKKEKCMLPSDTTRSRFIE